MPQPHIHRNQHHRAQSSPAAHAPPDPRQSRPRKSPADIRSPAHPPPPETSHRPVRAVAENGTRCGTAAQRHHSHQNRHSVPVPLLQRTRPQKIKLLLHAQRPQVPQKPRMRKIKVRQVQRRRRHVIPTQLTPENHKHRQHEHHRRRKNPVRPPNIKFSQPDRRSFRMFLEQQRRNQISRDNKKDSHSQIRKCSRHIRVITQLRPMPHHDQRNRNCPHAIQRRNPLHTPRSLAASRQNLSDTNHNPNFISADFPTRNEPATCLNPVNAHPRFSSKSCYNKS